MRIAETEPITRRLIIMRHSKAAYGGNDYARPLTEQGRRIAALQGGVIAQRSKIIDLAIVSSAARAK